MSNDTFIKVYKPVNQEYIDLLYAIKKKCDELECLMEKVNSREMSLAKTNLEQASMWAIKAVLLDDEKNKEVA